MFNALFSFLGSCLASVSGSAAVHRDGEQLSTSYSTQPAFNIDGSPMVGYVDIHGRPYGVVSNDEDTSYSSFQPAVNIDGTPMVGDIDLNGNIYGVVSDDFSSHYDTSSLSACSFPSDDSWNCSQDWSASDAWSSSDSFSSDCSSGSDW